MERLTPTTIAAASPRKTKQSRRAGWIPLATALALGAAVEAGTQRYSRNAPFAGLDRTAHVSTSNDEYDISVYWDADRYTVRYPDRDEAFDQDSKHADDLAPSLRLHCRADGRAEGWSGPRPLWADGRLPMHPNEPDVPGPFNIRYWIRLTLGGEWTKWPGRIRLGEERAYEGEVRMQRVHYSFARPDVQVVAVGQAARTGLSRLAAGRAWRWRIRGKNGLHVDARLPEKAELREVAVVMLEHCP